MKYRQSFGKWGENLAAQFLIDKGMAIINRNVRTAAGEIDILAQDGETLVFVEVKTRSTLEFGFPEEAVTQQKREHLIHSAEDYLQAHPDIHSDWRIDVIAIRRSKDQASPEIEWFENALA